MKWRERKVSYGKDNPDKIFYVIRRATCNVGLFSYVLTNMGLVKEAVEKSYIPVIDMQNNKNNYLDAEKVGKENAWEYFFEQPCGYSLTDTMHSHNVILSNGIITEKNDYPGHEIVNNREKRTEWKKIFNKYFLIKEDIKQETERLYQNMFQGEKVLGVLCRGTDYLYNHPPNHPVQPEPKNVILKATEVMRKYRCKWIYLATEDENIYQQFYKAFGSSLKVTSAKRSSDISHSNINDIMMREEDDRKKIGRNYLINILLLAKCDCLVAGSVGGTYGALLLTKGYEYEYIFDLGVYGS